MARLLHRYYINCPSGEAAALFRKAVESTMESDGSIDLCTTFPFEGRERTVHTKALIESAVDGAAPEAQRIWRIVWPEGRRPPTFDGLLSMRDERDFAGCVLQIEGDWIPADTEAASAERSRDAAATARELLRRVSAAISDAHAHRNEGRRQA